MAEHKHGTGKTVETDQVFDCMFFAYPFYVDLPNQQQA